MLFTTVPVDQKYEAKNFIDTVVAYRGADALSAWVKSGVDLIAQQPAVVALLGTALAPAWAASGAWLAHHQPRPAAADANGADADTPAAADLRADPPAESFRGVAQPASAC
jgi:AAA family ATP:ADP antiporter